MGHTGTGEGVPLLVRDGTGCLLWFGTCNPCNTERREFGPRHLECQSWRADTGRTMRSMSGAGFHPHRPEAMRELTKGNRPGLESVESE